MITSKVLELQETRIKLAGLVLQSFSGSVGCAKTVFLGYFIGVIFPLIHFSNSFVSETHKTGRKFNEVDIKSFILS